MGEVCKWKIAVSASRSVNQPIYIYISTMGWVAYTEKTKRSGKQCESINNEIKNSIPTITVDINYWNFHNFQSRRKNIHTQIKMKQKQVYNNGITFFFHYSVFTFFIPFQSPSSSSSSARVQANTETWLKNQPHITSIHIFMTDVGGTRST
jgi:hypothetical protein